ncbi:MAG: bifunctional demethylmenaquinone methyltransferase/2-methoxy-6-polyprenyl-1,4-benzoquinol methylase UbiE [Rikenellaceae bacterium]|jgi:demethylmenaquinone methyltransferase/2-methoxy-6-polyprenyl-1,4-benzoquinol methylase|nr:bifunctional demethylmenaquinone methyltransferase/2-methoxy-6-polyprenyl-1,4-benzoquinol methylase UbiE [Rikenellaceae bacterium]
MPQEIKPYDQQAEKGDQVRTMFDRIALRYDLLNHLLSMGVDRSWRRRTVQRVKAVVGEDTEGGLWAKENGLSPKILDVATGTGDLALMLARAIPEARITGVDLSSGMLKIATRKVACGNLGGRIALCKADVTALPFSDGGFDAVTVAFGVRNFEQIGAGLAEMARVLRPDGKLYVLEFSMPANKVIGSLYAFYFRKMLPWIGGVISGERQAYRYLQRSVEAFPYGDRFERMLLDAGFSQAGQARWTSGLVTLYTATK